MSDNEFNHLELSLTMHPYLLCQQRKYTCWLVLGIGVPQRILITSTKNDLLVGCRIGYKSTEPTHARTSYRSSKSPGREHVRWTRYNGKSPDTTRYTYLPTPIDASMKRPSRRERVHWRNQQDWKEECCRWWTNPFQYWYTLIRTEQTDGVYESLRTDTEDCYDDRESHVNKSSQLFGSLEGSRTWSARLPIGSQKHIPQEDIW